MKRENIQIDGNFLMKLIHNNPSALDKDYELIENKIHSCDEEDGGGWYTVVIKRKSDDKYFTMEYCDWEMNNREISGDLVEVFPRQVTITIYE